MNSLLEKFVKITAEILLFFDEEYLEEGIDDPYVVACREKRERAAAVSSAPLSPITIKKAG